MAEATIAPLSSSFSNFDGLRRVQGIRRAVAISNGSSPAASICVQASAAPAQPPAMAPAKRSKVELFKEASDFLRHPLIEDLATDAPNVSAASEQLIKFHGSYMQDNREQRQAGSGRAFQFMMRTRQPGGKVDNRLYLTMDDLADKFGNGTLRLTTRQTFQLHGVVKANLKEVFATVIRNMGSTLGACGDLNRNVLAPEVPFNDRPAYRHCQEYADKIAQLLAPQAGAYWDVWLDGEKVLSAEEPEDVVRARMDNTWGTNFEGSAEPIYGTQYLPRKFKIAVTVPGDNCVDLLTNDLALVAMCDDSTGELLGFNMLVGGGMGRSHRNDATEPRLAEPLGFVRAADALHAVKAVVVAQRDYGRRDDRKQARLKYLIREWGIDKFRRVTEQYLGKPFEEFRPLPEWESKPYVGWGDQGDGRLFYGLHIENGRIKGDQKKALRAVIEKYNLPVRISANQNLLLCDIRKAWRPRITQELAAVGILGKQYVDPLNLTAMACPALPLCGLAIAEAERGLPDVLKRIRALLDKVGLRQQQHSLVVRMTGCPNGCARPYVAELGFVGDGPNSYQLWLGGTPNQTQLARVFLERVKVQELEAVLEPVFAMWKAHALKGESFGDFTNRVGFEAIKEYMGTYVAAPARRRAGVRRITVDDEVAGRLEAEATRRGTTVAKLTREALVQFLGEQQE
eukprot:TRINITY_DN80482_c0_g1_i1.p1 TRINITY_DN80482_c0_g1~~TRINITY_DN80482_c0_g1_i1.p1  ORF type:complete len:683 (-),score=46.99 TRINITY_DN80482_c0_g1_i1:103-2151(-)